MAAPARLLLTEQTWRTTVALLDYYARLGLEAGLNWYGVRAIDVAVVSLIGIPQQTNRQTNFDVEADSLATLTRRVPEPLVVVAQLHTHPGVDTNHSSWDDGRALSRKILSLVLPHYGRNAALDHVGVHEFVEDKWRRMDAGESARRISVVPDVIDARK
jgi:hypothetical protein